MKDRISTEVLANGAIRYAEYDSSGNLIGYKYLKPADNPTEIGTYISKATMLADDAAEKYGLNENAVPNDIFDMLGKFYLHWWSVSGIIAESIELGLTENTWIGYFTTEVRTFEIADAVSVAQDGTVSLVNPTSLRCEGGSDIIGKFNTYVKGKYYKNGNDIYYKNNEDASYLGGYSPWVVYAPSQEVIGIPRHTSTDAEYVQSTNRNEYPDDGDIGDLHYKYLGVPFENLLIAGKIETGSYVGTGTYGASNPNSLTFSFVPKLVILSAVTDGANVSYSISPQSGYWGNGAIWVEGTTLQKIWAYDCTFSISGKTLSWYGLDRDSQLNYNNLIYAYIAIG